MPYIVNGGDRGREQRRSGRGDLLNILGRIDTPLNEGKCSCRCYTICRHLFDATCGRLGGGTQHNSPTYLRVIRGDSSLLISVGFVGLV